MFFEDVKHVLATTPSTVRSEAVRKWKDRWGGDVDGVLLFGKPETGGLFVFSNKR